MKKHGFAILVVEDDPNDQNLIVNAFRKLNVEGGISIVSDGSRNRLYDGRR